MFKPAINLVLYGIRASGLVMLGIVSIVFIMMPLFVTERNFGIFTSLFGVWLLAAVVLSWPRVPDAWRKDPLLDFVVP